MLSFLHTKQTKYTETNNPLPKQIHRLMKWTQCCTLSQKNQLIHTHTLNVVEFNCWSPKKRNSQFKLKTGQKKNNEHEIRFETRAWFSIVVLKKWTINEQNYNKKSNHDEEFANILNAFWLTAITFLCVGYGDIVPNTYCGRGITLTCGMVVSIPFPFAVCDDLSLLVCVLFAIFTSLTCIIHWQKWTVCVIE